MKRVIQILAVLALAISCDQTTATTDESSRYEAPDTVALKRFEPESLPQAVSQMNDILRNPKDAGARRRLSQTYADLGLLSMSRFFSLSVDVLERNQAHVRPIPKGGWGCAPHDQKTLDTVRTSTRLLEEGKPAESLKVLERALEDEPVACPLLIQSAVSLLQESAMTGRKIDLAEFERAMRILLTIHQEIGLEPYWGGSEWPYVLLSGHFAGEGDLPSAYVAASIARDEIRKQSEMNEGPSPAALKQVDDLLNELRRELGIR